MTGICRHVTTIACGRTSVVKPAEARFAALRTQDGGETPGLFTGCEEVSPVLSLYRCLQCGRWMHSQCLQRHFDTSASTPKDLGPWTGGTHQW